MQLLIAWAATAAAFLVLDFVWLGVLAPRVYRPRLAQVMMEQGVRWAPALAFYALYTLLVSVLAVLPATSPSAALLTGALAGLLAYATYDLTNWATLKQWSPFVTALDMAWGTVATAAACWIGASAMFAFA